MLIFLTCVLLYGVGLVTPQFLQQLMGYTSLSAGIATAPLGLGAMASMILVGYLVAKFDALPIVVFGFLIFALATFLLSRISLTIGPWDVFWPQILAGSAIGFLFVPCSLLGTARLRRDQIGSATGFMNLMRNVGGSVGIAAVSTYIVRRSQTHQSMLVQHVTPENPLVRQAIVGLQYYFHIRQGNCGAGSVQALGMLYRLLQQQSYLLAFIDVYSGLAFVAFAAILLVFLFEKVTVDPTHLSH